MSHCKFFMRKNLRILWNKREASEERRRKLRFLSLIRRFPTNVDHNDVVRGTRWCRFPVQVKFVHLADFRIIPRSHGGNGDITRRILPKRRLILAHFRKIPYCFRGRIVRGNRGNGGIPDAENAIFHIAGACRLVNRRFPLRNRRAEIINRRE